jgi:2'-5' RNA ligase
MSRGQFGMRGKAGTPLALPARVPGSSGRDQHLPEHLAHHRIFVAVTLAPALRDAVAGLRPHLASVSTSLRWVSTGNLHFTLQFLGRISAAQVARVTEVTREVARRAQSFAITLGGVGAFPSPRRPQVVWVGVPEGADRLTALADDLDRALHWLKFPPEPRPFRPHLTVARVKASGAAPDLSGLLPGLRGLVIGSQAVDALLVMESTLKPAGAVYHAVDEVRLCEPG